MLSISRQQSQQQTRSGSVEYRPSNTLAIEIIDRSCLRRVVVVELEGTGGMQLHRYTAPRLGIVMRNGAVKGLSRIMYHVLCMEIVKIFHRCEGEEGRRIGQIVRIRSVSHNKDRADRIIKESHKSIIRTCVISRSDAWRRRRSGDLR